MFDELLCSRQIHRAEYGYYKQNLDDKIRRHQGCGVRSPAVLTKIYIEFLSKRRSLLHPGSLYIR
jgi:hypothetical protein